MEICTLWMWICRSAPLEFLHSVSRGGAGLQSCAGSPEPAPASVARLCRQKCRHGTLRARATSAQRLPFRDAVFDFATAFMSLMDMPEPLAALREACRVVKPGGFLQFSITHPCFDPPYRKLLRDAGGNAYAVRPVAVLRGTARRQSRTAAVPSASIPPSAVGLAERGDRRGVSDRACGGAVRGPRAGGAVSGGGGYPGSRILPACTRTEAGVRNLQPADSDWASQGNGRESRGLNPGLIHRRRDPAHHILHPAGVAGAAIVGL